MDKTSISRNGKLSVRETDHVRRFDALKLGCSPNLVYHWKAEAEAAQREDRASEIKAGGVRDPRDIKRILDLEDELKEYKKKLAEQIPINDLLKKLPVFRWRSPRNSFIERPRTRQMIAAARSSFARPNESSFLCRRWRRLLDCKNLRKFKYL